MDNLRKEINAAKKELYAKVNAIYISQSCNTAAQLIKFSEEEPFLLMELQQQAYNSVRKACYVGMKADGMEFPEVFWARKIDEKYEYPVFKQIKDQAIRIQQPNSHSASSAFSDRQDVNRENEHSKGKETDNIRYAAGIGVTGLGIAATLYSWLADVSGLLTGLGIVAAVGGVLIMVTGSRNADNDPQKLHRSDKPATTAESGECSEQKQVHQILSNMNKVNKAIVDDWCSNVLKLVEDAATKEDT